MLNGSQYIRRELMIRLVRAFDDADFARELDRIPIHVRPANEPSSRCCVYHDRAVLKYRLMSLLGVSCHEETDEAKTLEEYYSDILRETAADAPSGEKPPLSVCQAACHACPPSRVVVTGNCQGCFSRPCLHICPKRAITVTNQASAIDQSACVKCGKCIGVCPFHAIVKTTVPCEDACPVNAIRKNEQGVAHIDFAKCIFCGKCFSACPFGAILERSQLVRILLALRRKEELVALVAPSALGQFPGTVEQLFAAILQVGFSDVLEVALGAEVTTSHETGEFMERLAKDPNTLMTTSCCPAYVELVRKHIPALLPRVSTAASPMVYARELAKRKHPNAKTVFIGPCIAKRAEAQRKNVDYVLSFEELGAIFAGRKIDPMTCEPYSSNRPASAEARNFARSCGVTEAVLAEATSKIAGFKLNSAFIDGLDKKGVTQLKLFASGKMPGNFLEVMACGGGCVNGPCSLKK